MIWSIKWIVLGSSKGDLDWLVILTLFITSWIYICFFLFIFHLFYMYTISLFAKLLVKHLVILDRSKLWLKRYSSLEQSTSTCSLFANYSFLYIGRHTKCTYSELYSKTMCKFGKSPIWNENYCLYMDVYYQSEHSWVDWSSSSMFWLSSAILKFILWIMVILFL